MSKKVKKRKKAIPIKQAATAALSILRVKKLCAVRMLSDIALAKQQGKQGNTAIQCYSTGKIVENAHSVHKSFVHFEFNWTIILFILGRDQFGNEYIKDTTLNISKCKHDLIAETVGDMLDTFENQFNKQHMINKGWIAIPYEQELSEKQTENLLKRGFKFLAKWEEDERLKEA